MLLGIIVTITHVAAVFALGIIVLLASKYVMPESVYPWLGFVSGVMIAAIGVWQFTRRFAIARLRSGDEHGHSHALPDRVTMGSLVTLGISGGIVPCPSALVVLLSAIALHRVGFGLVLIVFFSMGLAAVLIAIGMTMLYARRVAEKFEWQGGWIGKLKLASPIAIALLGGAIAIQSALTGDLWTLGSADRVVNRGPRCSFPRNTELRARDRGMSGSFARNLARRAPSAMIFPASRRIVRGQRSRTISRSWVATIFVVGRDPRSSVMR